MKRKWVKIDDHTYMFEVDGQEMGRMNLDTNSTSIKAYCTLENKNYLIQRTGFWKNSLEVLNEQGELIAKTYREKWFSNESKLEMDHKKYTLTLRNNPIAEWAIMDDKTTLLAYGLMVEKGKTHIKISAAPDHENVLMDYLLWFLFYPIAVENASDQFLLHLLLTTA